MEIPTTLYFSNVYTPPQLIKVIKPERVPVHAIGGEFLSEGSNRYRLELETLYEEDILVKVSDTAKIASSADLEILLSRTKFSPIFASRGEEGIDFNFSGGQATLSIVL